MRRKFSIVKMERASRIEPTRDQPQKHNETPRGPTIPPRIEAPRSRCTNSSRLSALGGSTRAREPEMSPRVNRRRHPRSGSRLPRRHQSIKPTDIQFDRILDFNGTFRT